MIYELRTYTLKPGSVPEFEERFAKRKPLREKHSKLGGFWHTEFGTLNQVVHIWPYENLQHRQDVRDAMAQDPDLRAIGGSNVILQQESEIYIPAPFMRPLGGDQALGGIYEMRIYTFEPGSIPELIKRWSEAIPFREKFSPLAVGMSTEFGGLNRWMHVWPYKDLAERTKVRAEANKIPQWPTGSPGRVRQENKILVPSSFSPMH